MAHSVWPPHKMMLYLGIIKKYKHMFWILFAIFVFIGCAIAYVVDFFNQLQTSEYEIVRVIYWALKIALFIALIVWIANW